LVLNQASLLFKVTIQNRNIAMNYLSYKQMTNTLGVVIGSFFIITTANAHDASMHKKDTAQKPQCETMDNIDHSKMDMNDPIMQAMMQQCMGDNSHNQAHPTNEEPQKANAKKQNKDKHQN
jgi:hypothetical protein